MGITATGSVLVDAGNIDLVDMTGDILGPITATTGNIASITATGSIRGDIRAPQGSINLIQGTSFGSEIARLGDSPGNRLIIQAMDGINVVVADTIRANITANSSGSGAIRRVQTYSGNLVGSLAAAALNWGTAGDGLLIPGNLEAAVNIPGTLSAPIRVGGDIQNGGSLTSGALLNANDAEIDITGALNGNLSVGAVSRRLRVQGAVSSGRTLTTGAINNVSTSSLVIGGAVNGAVSVNGNISAASSVGGGIPGTLTVNGNVAAPVNVSGGVSGSLTINSTVTSPVTITGGAISGLVDINAGLGAAVNVSQPISGTLMIDTVGSAGSLVLVGGVTSTGTVDIVNNCTGPITLSAAMNGRIDIGGSLTNTLTLPAGGLVGQVLIGTNSPFTSSWSGSPTIGGIALNNPPKSTLPAYRHPSMSYGNGAIALAPFRLYGDDCMPMVSGSGVGSLRITPLTDGSEPAVIAFYGPITSSAAIGSSLIITRDDSADVTSQFTAALASVHGSDARAIRITANSGAGVQINRDYTVTPVFDAGVPRIRSNLGLGANNPGVVTQVGGSTTPGFAFTFRVVNDCFDPRADFNDDGDVNADDLGDFINCYFSEVGTPSSCPAADFNDDSDVNPDDLGDFINVYFCNA